MEGPDPDALFRPNEAALAAAREASERLRKLCEAYKDSHDGLDIFAEECIRAADSLKSLDWEAIRVEKYHLTPEGLFSELVRNAESNVRRHVAEEKRRQEWLDAGEDDQPEEQGGEGVPHHGQADKFGVNLDRFKDIDGKRPHGWARACQTAAWIAIDEMRTLLELATVFVSMFCI